ncbi:MAG: beta strand repeat-containing protein, partial [Planctomycetota bacterium]
FAPATGQSYQLQVSVENHPLALAFLQGDGFADPVVRFQGNTTFINQALDGLVFTPNQDFNGNATLVVATDDLGNWHDAPNSGASLFDTDTLTISVLAVNDAPVLNVPSTQFVREDEPLVFSAANGNLISVVDVDVLEATPRDTAAGVGVLELQLIAVNGLMTFTAASLPVGLWFSTGDGTADPAIVVRGTPAELNVALDGLRFDGFANFSGAASISFAVRDFGNRGAGVLAVEPTVLNQSASASYPNVTIFRVPDGAQFVINNGIQDYVFEMDAGPEVLQNVNEKTTNAIPSRVIRDGNFFLLDPNASVNGNETLFQMDTGPVFVVLDATSLFNQTVSVTGSGGTQVFEFVPSGGKALTAGATAVDISGNLTPSGVAGFLRDAINAGGSGVTASAVGERLSFASDSAVQSNTTNISVVGNQGLAPILEAVRGNQLVDGETFRLSFGGGSTFTFEFDTGFGGVTPGNISVPFTSGQTVTQVAAAIQTAIDGSGAPVTTQLVTSVAAGYGRIVVNGPSVTFSALGSPLTNMVTRLSPRVFTIAVEESFTAAQLGAAVAQRVVQTSNFMASADGGRINFPPPKVAPPATPAGRIPTAAADFNGVPVWVDQGSMTGVAFGNIAVPFWAEDSADELARQIKAAIDATAISGLTTVQNGASVVVNGMTGGAISTFIPFAGGGGPLFASTAVPIAIAAVNDAPVNYLQGNTDFIAYVNASNANPATLARFTMNEDSNLVFSATNGNQITIDDPADGTTQSVRVTLTATNGVITLPSSAGLTFPIAGQDGITDPTVTFEGTISTINARLNGLIFRPTANFDGLAELRINTNDRGFVGADGPKSDEDFINIVVLPLNDAPSNIVPAVQTVAEDVALAFTTAGGNPVRINDDAGALPVDVLLTATNGVVTLGSTTGITTVTGNGTGSLSLVGPLNAINAALQTLTFRGNQDFNGQATMVIRTNDLGNAGGSTAQIDTDTVTINVTPVNDPPVNFFNGLTTFGTVNTTDEDPVTLSAAGSSRLSISDVDAGSGVVRVTLTGGNGVATLGSRSGLTFTVGDGTADAVMTFSGTIAAINTALTTVTFRPNDFFSGNATLVISTSDQGLTGAGGIQIDTDTVTIAVAAVNDPPVNTVPGPQTFNEDTVRVFSTANGNQIIVSDDAITTNSDIRVDVSVVDTGNPTSGLGTLALGPNVPVGLVVEFLNPFAIRVVGKVGDINTALNGLSFTPPLNYNGGGVLSVTTNDLGNSPVIAIPNIVASTVALNISAVNDAPVNTLPVGPININEDTTVNFTAGQWAVSDADAASGSIRVTLAATLGTLSLSPSTLGALSFLLGTGTANATMVFEGTLVNVNAALNTLSFVPTANLSGDAVITILSDDRGLSGSGGMLTDSDSLTITIAPINDAPTVTVPGTQTASEDSVFQFTSANAMVIVDDAGASEILASIAISNGVGSLGNIAGLAAPPTGQGTATIDVRG